MPRQHRDIEILEMPGEQRSVEQRMGQAIAGESFSNGGEPMRILGQFQSERKIGLLVCSHQCRQTDGE
jgi:hypothetical protein